jgi:hypothetical protein
MERFTGCSKTCDIALGEISNRISLSRQNLSIKGKVVTTPVEEPAVQGSENELYSDELFAVGSEILRSQYRQMT